MGKTKQAKEKKFDRNVEISAPILDPEIIKAIHTPPKGQRLDIRHGGFKALLSDLNSQDSTDELMPVTDNHVPSYIGISCAVSGYSNYSAYTKKPGETITATTISAKTSTAPNKLVLTPNRSQTNSPVATRIDQNNHINHITIDKSHISSVDEERKELTEKLTASATERHRRSPSPILPPEDDRHHGAYVGARYCPMPPPSKLVHKHIPLLGIDDDQDPDQVVAEDENKVEKKIASLYGDTFVEDWRESMSHRSKKEHNEEQPSNEQSNTKSPKDIVSLKPVPSREHNKENEEKTEPVLDIAPPNVKVLANVEKEFLHKLLTDENPPMPKSPSPVSSPVRNVIDSPKASPAPPSPQLVPDNRDDYSNVTGTGSPPALVTTTREEITTITATNFLDRSPSPPIATTRDDIITMSPENTHSASPPPVATTRDDLINISPDRSPSPPIATTRDDVINVHQDEVRSPSPPIARRDDLITISPDQEAGAQDDIIDISPERPQQESPVPMSPDSGKNQSIVEDIEHTQPTRDLRNEDHIEYEIRAESPVDNQASPVRAISNHEAIIEEEDDEPADTQQVTTKESSNEKLVSFSPDVPSPERTDEEQERPIEGEVNSDGDKLILEAEPAADGSSSSSSKLVEVVESSSDNNNNGRYYLDLLEQEKSFILTEIAKAEAILAEHKSHLDEDTIGRIDSAIGKANLLINKKFNQFKDLCEKSINQDSDERYAVLNDDLAGFWDLLSIQMADVRKSFENLQPARL